MHDTTIFTQQSCTSFVHLDWYIWIGTTLYQFVKCWQRCNCKVVQMGSHVEYNALAVSEITSLLNNSFLASFIFSYYVTNLSIFQDHGSFTCICIVLPVNAVIRCHLSQHYMVDQTISSHSKCKPIYKEKEDLNSLGWVIFLQMVSR